MPVVNHTQGLIGQVKTRLFEYFVQQGYTDFQIREPEPVISHGEPGPITPLIDHTLLGVETDRLAVHQICSEAKHYGFASVCVNPFWVPFAAELLADSNVKVCTVVGFPLGATLPEVKALETRQAVDRGAAEIDMVMNIGALKSQEYAAVYEDVLAVVNAASGKALVKVIIETAVLTDAEKIAACIIAGAAGADYVKTSTGFAKGGATIEDVTLMRAVVGNTMGVKASGGIRDYVTAVALVKAGADRIGTSAGVTIAEEEAAALKESNE